MGETVIAAIISGIISLIVGFLGGISTYHFINKKKIIQKQKARDGASQVQIGEIYGKSKKDSKSER